MNLLKEQPGSSSRQMTTLTTAYRSLLATTLITLAMEVVFSTISCKSLLLPRHLRSISEYSLIFFRIPTGFLTSQGAPTQAGNSPIYDLGVLGPYWAFAILGTATNAVIFYRSFETAAPSPTSHNTRTTRSTASTQYMSKPHRNSSAPFGQLSVIQESTRRYDSYSDHAIDLPRMGRAGGSLGKKDLAFTNVRVEDEEQGIAV